MSTSKKMPIEWLTARIGDYTDDAILITEAEPISDPGPRILWCNPSFETMTGYSLKDIKGISPRFLQGEDTDRSALQKIRNGLENWEKVRVDLKNYRKDGSAFWVDMGIHPVCDDSGWFHYWIAIQREMPSRTRSEEVLRKANAVTENAPIILGLLDSQNQLIFANDFFGETVFPDILSPGLPFPYESWLRRGLIGNQSGVEGVNENARWIERHVTAIRSPRRGIEQKLKGRWYEFRCIATSDGEHLIIGEDIEDKMALQAQVRQMAKLEAMGQLTSGVAHDFNNILAVILGNAELAKLNSTTKDDRAEFVDETIKAAKKGRSLTQSLLSFARKSHMTLETVQIGKLVTDAAEMFQRASGGGTTTNLQIEDDLPPISIDVALMQNALLNLMLNARDAMQIGSSIEIMVSVNNTITLPNPTGDGRACEVVTIAICDQGVGMSENTITRSIEPFFSTKTTGSGLGLSMVHGFVEQSGGRLEIKSKKGFGTTVYMHMPSISFIEGVDRQSSRDIVFDMSGFKILVIEDDVAVRRLLVRILKNVGAHIVEMKSADEAYMQKEHWSEIDLLLSDIVVPGAMQGDVLAKNFSNFHPEKPVVLLSGNPDMIAKPLQTSTRFELLTKPVDRAELLSVMARLLMDAEYS